MHQRTNHRGFTIVEMLAVIGVIAVLLAILLPAIGAARRSALWGTSQSNLRQVGHEEQCRHLKVVVEVLREFDGVAVAQGAKKFCRNLRVVVDVRKVRIGLVTIGVKPSVDLRCR
jgi:prepilin-type N-terminal cleavage/methylation domain-containing protein